MAALEGGGDVGLELTELLLREESPEVRTRLYEAIPVQSEIPTPRLLEIVAEETEPALRLSGLVAAAAAIGKSRSAEYGSEFDRRFVGELHEIALNGEARSERYDSAVALKRAGTPASIEVLEEVAQSSDPFVARFAKRALEDL
jgi:hypothetical protein